MKNTKSFKLAKPVMPVSDEQREELLRKSHLMTMVSGWFFLLMGAQLFIAEILSLKVPGVLETIGTVIVLASMVMFLKQGLITAKYNLEPKDEFELQQESRAKSKAYNFLSTGIFFIFIFVPSVDSPNLVLAFLYMILGGSWLILDKNLEYRHVGKPVKK